MLTTNQLQVLVNVVDEIERRVLDDLRAGFITQEEDVTGALRTRLHDISESAAGGVKISVKILPSAGANSEESHRGADVEGSLRLRLDGLDVRKGFLVQAKMSGKDGVRISPPPDAPHHVNAGAGPHSFGGMLTVRPSGQVSLGMPSRRLVSQCEKMLRETSASYVWVYDLDQIAVVGALPVREARKKTPRTARTPLGTLGLSAFVLNVAQCFAGDEALQPSFDDPHQVSFAPTQFRVDIRG